MRKNQVDSSFVIGPLSLVISCDWQLVICIQALVAAFGHDQNQRTNYESQMTND
jgi:hypothetical protein